MFFSNKSQKRPIITKVTPKFETFSNLFHEWRCNHSSFLTLNFFASICFDSAWNWEFFYINRQGTKLLKYFKLLQITTSKFHRRRNQFFLSSKLKKEVCQRSTPHQNMTYPFTIKVMPLMPIYGCFLTSSNTINKQEFFQ